MRLASTSPAELTSYLRLRGWVADDTAVVSIGPAGPGNMNLVLRVALDDATSIVLKQGQPWVEKYPSIAAPAARTLVEGAFYAHVHHWPAVSQRMPRFIGLDRTDRVLALEDCPGADMTTLYAGTVPDRATIAALATYLLTLHGVPMDVDARTTFGNHEMRALNHEHIFDLPTRAANGVALDAICPGLEVAAREVRSDAAFVRRVHARGAEYLAADGPVLLHGDYFPGSWLATPNGLKVIDPEFCLPGPPEFDLGVCAAHFRLARLPRIVTQQLLRQYRRGSAVDTARVSAWAGVEMMRRLLGVAQLPLVADLPERAGWLDEARALVKGEAQVSGS